MLRHRVIPCLLLRGTGLVKTTRFENPRYVGDPINAIKVFNTKEVDELVVLDISASVSGSEIQWSLISDLASECFMPLGYGGGIRSVEDMQRLFALGVEKVVLNSAALENPDLVSEAASIFGSQSIVVSVDVKKRLGRYRVHGYSGTKRYDPKPEELARAVAEAGAGEIFLNSIDRDGTRSGFDLALIRRITDAVTVPVVACGGADTVSDFAEAISEGGASAVAAGSMFVFHGRHQAVLISYPDYGELERVLNGAA